jgi:bacillithiol biosynthesis deacetylase BshB1
MTDETSALRRPCDVLCVGAHPDDVEMGMAGTVAALRSAGHSVSLLVLTRGELGTYGDADTREVEARAAAEILGCSLEIWDLPDGGVVDELETRHRLALALREYRPQLVFAPYPHSRAGAQDGRANVDHLACGLLVREATKLARFRKLLPETPRHEVGRLLYYMVPEDRRPSFVVDVSRHEETLVAAIRAYASQLEIRRGRRDVLDVLLLWRRSAGQRIRAELGEGFLCEDSLSLPAELLLRI